MINSSVGWLLLWLVLNSNLQIKRQSAPNWCDLVKRYTVRHSEGTRVCLTYCSATTNETPSSLKQIIQGELHLWCVVLCLKANCIKYIQVQNSSNAYFCQEVITFYSSMRINSSLRMFYWKNRQNLRLCELQNIQTHYKTCVFIRRNAYAFRAIGIS